VARPGRSAPAPAKSRASTRRSRPTLLEKETRGQREKERERGEPKEGGLVVLWDRGQTVGNAVTTLNSAPVTRAEGAE
jgi:hypothetical protein